MEFKDNNISKIIFITGGTKSGKSEFAEYLAKGSNKLSYVALSVNNPADKEWQEKIGENGFKKAGFNRRRAIQRQ